MHRTFVKGAEPVDRTFFVARQGRTAGALRRARAVGAAAGLRRARAVGAAGALRRARAVGAVAGLRRALALAVAALALAVAPAAAFAAPAPIDHWAFDEGSGTTAADSAGHHPATLLGGAGWATGIKGPFALATNGASAYADTGATVIDPTKSFTVSAWARFNRIAGYQTVVSLDGNQVSNFYLQLRGDTGRFAFVRLSSDSTQAAAAFPSATFDPSANTWYLLTGVYDAAAGTYSLYVDGQLQDTVAAPPAWKTTGHLVIGRGKFAGNPVDWVNGSIDDVRVYQSALAPGDIAQLAIAGLWRLNEGSGTTAADSSLDHHTATLSGGASWTKGVVGSHALLFDGTSGAAEADGPVIDTSQGFSVAAWVRVDSATGFRTAVSVDSGQVSGFFLQRRDDGRFAFTKLGSDSPGPGTFAASDETARVGQWYHLVGVYDSAAGTLTLYVNGVRQQTVSAPDAWRATGHFVIGRGEYAGAPTDWFAGAVDDVRAYPFPVDAKTAQALATSGLWHFDEDTGTIAHDSSPDFANGTLHHAGWTTGPSGSAVSLNGHAWVDMGDHPALDLGTGAASVAAWFETKGNGSVVSKNHAYAIAVQGGRVTAAIGNMAVATTDTTFADGDWHHAALVLDRTSQRLMLYVDGEPARIAPQSGSCGTLATNTALDVSSCHGAADSSSAFLVGDHLTGAVDEVEVVRFALSATQVAQLAGANQLTIDATDLRAHTRSTEFGLMLEDISHSGDGGLYAELVRNRTFKEPWQGNEGTGPVPYWSLLQHGGATGSFAIDTSEPLNDAIDRSLKVHVDSLGPGGRLAASNGGYYGVAVAPGTTYTGSLWAKATAGFTGRLRVSLEKPDGTVLASTDAGSPTTAWGHFSYTLTTPGGIAQSTDNRVVVSLVSDSAVSDQDVWLSVVSLFPPTYKGHGLRTDIMEKLAAMHPGFFRVPGGNYLEGATLDTRFQWKQTLGPIWERPGHMNTAWGYWSTDGLGLEEYLQMAEDLGAQPLLAVFAGYTLNGQHVSEDDYGTYIQDALDEIEYAIGDTSTTWGARRAADGHPAPFNLHYVEIGNEDWFDASGSYSWRFTRMYEAIKSRYPQLKLIATTGGYQGGAASSTSSGTTPDVVDDHYYEPPQWFDDNATRYDTAGRSGPQVLVGEYGAQEGTPTGTLRAAVGEAAFLTGLERNSDIVIGSTFAPLIVNENAPNWPTNLIGIDAGESYGSPSYWMERTFSNNTGADVVGTRLAGAGGLREVVTETRDASGGATFYLKIVNYGGTRQTARITFQDVTRIDPTATMTVLTGDPLARNSLEDPTHVVPTTTEVTGLTTSSRFKFPPYSVTVLRVTAGA